MAKRGARVGAAAVALGLSLAGPQAIGSASAEVSDPDTAPGPAGASADGQNPGASSTSTSGKARASRNGSSAATLGGASTAAVVGSSAAGPARPSFTRPDLDGPDLDGPDLDGSDPGRLDADRRRPVAGNPGADTGPVQSPAAVPAATVPPPAPAAAAPVITPLTVAAPATPSAANPLLASAASAGPERRPLKPVSATAGAAAAPAGAVATMGAAVTRFFDSAANWMSQLPRGPVAEFLQGAMLLVRRTLLGFIGGTGGGQTGGQNMDTPYLTEAELQDYLLAMAAERYGSLFGQTVPHYGYGYKWYDGALVPATSTSGGRGGSTSDTNTQVEGVDEADFVETDGRYIFVARGGTLAILDGATLSSQTALSGHVVGQFLSGDRLTVITQSGGGWYGPMVKMAYGPWWEWNPQTTVTVFDVTDRAAPVVASQTVFDGAYRDARAVDGTVYLVLDRTVKLPEPLYTEVPAPESPSAETMLLQRYGPEVISYRTYETWDAYVARVGDQITTLSLPHAYTVGADGALVDLGVIAGAGDIVRPRSQDAQSLVTVVSIDAQNASTGSGFASGVGALVSSGGATVYMTPDALYLATAQDDYSDTGSSTQTRIDRFTVTATDVGWQSSGVVPGTLINQFAMDERAGYLRVATHTWSSNWAGGTWATVRDSGVYILDTEGPTLDITGSVTGLAPGEQLFAVRFVGDDGYLVTFLQTDPLFAIDLSDPAAPVLEGELVIPGFSNYLQSVGPGLLLGIGQEREPGTWNTRLHVSLFDVSDGTAPREIERQFLDESSQWSASDAQWDHHALLYSAEDGLLVVPMNASGYDPQSGQYSWGQTLQVLRVTSTGIDTVGSIVTDGSVLRTVRIGDVLYAVSETSVTAYSLTDLTEIGRAEIGRAEIERDQSAQPVPLLA